MLQAPHLFGREGNPYTAPNGQPWPDNAFRFALPRGGRAHIEAYDATGRRIATVLDEALAAGEHAGAWDGRTSGRAAAAGVYYLRLLAPGVQSSARMVIGH